MKYKRFLIVFLTWIVVTGALFWIGEQFSISWLMFSYEYEANGEGFSFSAGSFVPLLIGLAVSGMAEAMYARKIARRKAL